MNTDRISEIPEFVPRSHSNGFCFFPPFPYFFYYEEETKNPMHFQETPEERKVCENSCSEGKKILEYLDDLSKDGGYYQSYDYEEEFLVCHNDIDYYLYQDVVVDKLCSKPEKGISIPEHLLECITNLIDASINPVEGKPLQDWLKAKIAEEKEAKKVQAPVSPTKKKTVKRTTTSEASPVKKKPV